MTVLLSAMTVTPLGLGACTTATNPIQQAGYSIQERLGIEKRDILVDRVGDVAEAQGEAKEEFEDALSAFRAVVDVNAGDLESTYDDLSRAYDRAEDRANAVRSRVKSVRRVARDLFNEWEGELADFSDPTLRRVSEEQLRSTKLRYQLLTDKMDAATASMDPVLTVFNDRVLYLKHNLNARAIAALDAETADLEDDVARLIADMEQSIAAADAFILEMQG
ncbi:DUF2959 family protein [uncultured Algimonas sp.]|uniref:DUF2959 family protein n=1 Tax=uncultured Algimonas sp. TaxID=1547920 RepID=UPI00263090EE|nr:DUF2959 family protein [uncultured Algimonas sp.]